MSAQQLIRRCWVDDDTYDMEPGPHCESRAQIRGSDGRFRKARQLAPCWVVTCDGQCPDDAGLLEDSEEGWTVHTQSHASAEQAALLEGWVILRDGRAYCRMCAPDDVSPWDLAVVEQTPGQLALIGGEAA